MAKQNRAERQARLATPAPEAPTAKPPTRDELYADARRLGIKGASKFSRTQLVEALREHAAPLTPADRPVVNTPDISTVEGRRALANDRIAAAAEHYQEVMADPNAPKPEEDLAKRTIKAKAEQKALKAWQFGGMQGDRPVTPNYDAVCAVYAGVVKAPSSKAARRGGGGAKRESATPGGPRGIEAAAAKEACGGKRASTVKISDDDLRAYIVRVHQEHPESARQDEREYAFWVERLNLSGRFPRFWKELVTDADPDIDTEADTDLPSDDDADESPEAVKAALEHALRPKADKPVAAKRGDNLRSEKATAKKATAKKAAPAVKAAPKKAGARKEVTPIPKSTPRKRTRK